MSQLNEGWYQIKNGYVFYLESFNTPIPIYIKVKNSHQQNGMFVVEQDGNVAIKKITSEVGDFSDKITGRVTGLEGVSGF